MTKLIMMKGLPASGKTTRANEMLKEYGNFVRISRDDLRPMLHGDLPYNGKKEKVTINVQKTMVRGLLNSGQNVIIDDTNLTNTHLERWKGIASECGAQFVLEEMDTPLEVCLDRNDDRKKKVPRHVIYEMALQSGMFKADEVVVVDLDGTVADLSHRFHWIDREEKNWNQFFLECEGDSPIQSTIDMVKQDIADGKQIIFVSGRSDIVRDRTELWVGRHVQEDPIILMRRSFDKRPDTEVKKDIYDKYLKGYNILKVYDDRPSVIRMWQAEGLNVIDCGDGVEF